MLLYRRASTQKAISSRRTMSELNSVAVN